MSDDEIAAAAVRYKNTGQYLGIQGNTSQHSRLKATERSEVTLGV
jgi:hypothetical protein